MRSSKGTNVSKKEYLPLRYWWLLNSKLETWHGHPDLEMGPSNTKNASGPFAVPEAPDSTRRNNSPPSPEHCSCAGEHTYCFAEEIGVHSRSDTGELDFSVFVSRGISSGFRVSFAPGTKGAFSVATHAVVQQCYSIPYNSDKCIIIIVVKFNQKLKLIYNNITERQTISTKITICAKLQRRRGRCR